MSLRAVRVRNLLLLMAVFATVVVAGCWDSRRNMQRVLDEGYPAIVEITGAHYQRFAPFAFDGWRPRFVEQGLSVDLKWEGRDGKPHTFRKVPVTEGFARTIVSGEQVKLAIVPAKVMDDPHAVPVINADAVARFAALQEWLRDATLVAVAAWFGFGILGFWMARARGVVAGAGRAAVAGQAPLSFPLRRVLFGLVALLLGAVLTFRAWSVEDAASGAADGIETTAEITSASTVPAEKGGMTHVVQLSWKDPQGGVHHMGPVPVSDSFWAKITRNGELVTHHTRIRYHGQATAARPTLVDDQQTRPWQVEIALGVGVVLMAVGAGSLLSAANYLRPRRSIKKAKLTPKK